MRIDFTNCQLSNVKYGGSEHKIGIIFANQKWMLKFRKENVYGQCFNDVCEYIGSKVFSMLGFNTQEVLLGIYNKDHVVACKDFISGYSYTPFNDVGESSLETDKTKYIYSYDDIETLIQKNKKIVNKEETIRLFWETYVVDCLLANNDRHGKNWGFLKKDGLYYPAPIFDNGNSLFSNFSDEEEIKSVLEDIDEILDRVYRHPRSIVKNSKGLNDYYSVINSKEYIHCNEAIIKMVPIIEKKLKNIMSTIDSVDISDIRKRFIKTVISKRFELILLKTYKELKDEGN